MLQAYKGGYGSIRLSKKDKAQISLLEKRVKTFQRNLDARFVNRFARTTPIKKWRSALVTLNRTAQAISVDRPRDFSMSIFIPPQIRPFVTILDELGQ